MPDPNPKIVAIADALIAKAAAAGYLRTGLLNDLGNDWHSEDSTKAAYLGDSGERNVPKPTRSISPRAGFFFFSIVKGEAPTRIFWPLYKKLKDGIDADPTLGLGDDVVAAVTGYLCDKNIQQVIARVHTADIFVEVTYRHDRGNA